MNLNDLFGNGTTITTDSPLLTMSSVLQDQSAATGDDVERYSTDYYAGIQVACYIGSVWLSDLTMIQWEANQAKRPFYGYKSQKWDVMAKGTQIIQGGFAMNYIHTNYLNMVMAKYRELTETNTGHTQIIEAELTRFIDDLSNGSNTGSINASTLTYTASGVASSQDSNFAHLGYDTKQKVLQDFYWGNPGGNPSNKVIAADNLPAFDIVVSFGDYPATPGQGADEFISSHTLKVLTGIEILGHSTQISITGEPIQEIYTFAARSIDTPLTRIPKELKIASAPETNAKGHLVYK
jgi:hypothetical protein